MKISLLSIALLASTQSPCVAFIPHKSSKAFAQKTILHETTPSEKATKETDFVKDPTVYEGQAKDELDAISQSPKPAPPTPKLSEVFKGIKLPDWDTTQGLGVLNDETVKEVGAYAIQYAPPAAGAILNAPKSNERNLDPIREVVIKAASLEDSIASKDYQFFGNGDYEKQLKLLVKSNPFMASALTESDKGGFEIKAYDPDDKDPSLFLRVMRTLTGGGGHRVNFQFDDMLEITSLQVFDDTTGEEVTGDLDRKKYASAEIYNLFCYASSVHATIHVYHFLLTSAMMDATKDFEAMQELAISYGRNIRNKYDQVGTLLIQDPNPAEGDKVIVSGVNGMGSSQAIRPILEELVNRWGQTKSASDFFASWMNVPESKMKAAGVLVEFRKHLEMVAPFSRDLKRSMYRSDASPFGTKWYSSQKNLKTYLKSCGTFNSDINLVQQWLELMSITGIIHGATLSYTRVLGDPNVMRWRNAKSTNWDGFDLNMIVGGLGTIVGMEEGRHVMGSELDEGVIYHAEIQQVLDEYDGMAIKLKEAYKQALLEGDLEEFNNFGFILTDYGPDDFDGKQLTVASYI